MCCKNYTEARALWHWNKCIPTNRPLLLSLHKLSLLLLLTRSAVTHTKGQWCDVLWWKTSHFCLVTAPQAYGTSRCATQAALCLQTSSAALWLLQSLLLLPLTRVCCSPLLCLSSLNKSTTLRIGKSSQKQRHHLKTPPAKYLNHLSVRPFCIHVLTENTKQVLILMGDWHIQTYS